MTPKHWVAVAILTLALLFALQGGEFSTLEWLELRRQVGRERARVTELERRVDSLSRHARMVETDPETQERIARELHGMLKPGEHAFILEEAREPRP